MLGRRVQKGVTHHYARGTRVVGPAFRKLHPLETRESSEQKVESVGFAADVASHVRRGDRQKVSRPSAEYRRRAFRRRVAFKCRVQFYGRVRRRQYKSAETQRCGMRASERTPSPFPSPPPREIEIYKLSLRERYFACGASAVSRDVVKISHFLARLLTRLDSEATRVQRMSRD